MTGWLGLGRSRRDLLIVIVSTALVIWWSQQFHPADRFFFWSSTHWTQEHFDLDEEPIFLLWLAVALGWYAWRRSRDQALVARLRAGELVQLLRVEEALRLANEDLEGRVAERVRELEHETGQRLAAEAAASRLQTEIEHLNRFAALDVMTVGLAHELAQPCFALNNYLKGMCERLRSGNFIVSELLHASEQAIAQAERAAAIVDRFREFARRDQPKRELVDLAALLRQSGRIMTPLAERNGSTLEVEIAEPLPTVFGDRVQLEQVVVNVMVNAIEAMRAPGLPTRRLTVSARPGSGSEEGVRITVADTGPGIPPDMIERIFEPFITTRQQGTGLGLAICRSIVEAHGGSIHLEGNTDSSTRFTITLPAAAG